MSGLLASAKPYRIKASHRRRRKCASGQSVQRYYDPTIGRFLSVDPVSANANTGAMFNRYNYAANNPYRYTDPDGRVPRGSLNLCSNGCSMFDGVSGSSRDDELYSNHKYTDSDVTVGYRYNSILNWKSFKFTEFNQYLRDMNKMDKVISAVVSGLNDLGWKGTPYKVPIFLELASLENIGIPREFRYIANASGEGFSKTMVVNAPAFLRRDREGRQTVLRHEMVHTTIFNEALRRMWRGIESNATPPHERDAYDRE